MIYDDYIEYAKQYVEKYGDKCVVFMQVGDFFELYAIQNDTEVVGADIYKVCDLCNIQVSRKNKSVLENSRQNPLMAGFPIAAISKFVQILVQYQYTIVLIRQVTPPPNPKREVTEIISPSTYMNVSSQEGNYLMTMVWEQHSTQLWDVGITCLDLTTGASYVYETYSTLQDPNFAMDEAIRFIQSYQPKELLLMGPHYHKEIASYFENDRQLLVHHQWGEAFNKLYAHPAYQNTVLQKAFQVKGLLTPIEMMGLEKYPLAALTYCAMIQFAYEHNEQLIQKMELPTIWKNPHHLILEANSIQQLNVISQTNNEMPLLTLLNRCATAFGARLFKERLLNPIVDIATLNQYYDQIESYRQEELFKHLLSHLSSVMDLERILRRIALGTLQPCEWGNVEISLEACKQVFQLIDSPSHQESLEEMMDHYCKVLNLTECKKYNLVDIHTSLFNKEQYCNIDVLAEQLEEDFSFMKEWTHKISSIGENDSTLCRMDYNDRDGYFLSITKKRWDTVGKYGIQKLKIREVEVSLKDCKTKPISASSTNLRLTHSLIERVSDRIISTQQKLSNLNIKYYKEFLSQFDQKYHTIWRDLVKTIAEIDILATNAKNSLEYGYHRPKLISSNTSYLQAKGLRHPIIERLNHQYKYIPNDVALGIDKKGLLLYGINASGKSSLMKAIGLNIIMAQSGMYVPSEEIELAPYHHLFTRITSTDNIYRGHSTFTVEILELKNIMNRCDSYSLILGDELCSGTEAISAMSIVAAGIDYLLKQQACFVFATHLHELMKLTMIQSSPALWIAHMHIELDEITGKIIYDRKLKEGHGSSLYGLEVCRALKLPDIFLKMANQIRKEVQGMPTMYVESKVSKYNKDLIVSTCTLCGNAAHETHHIKQQKDANTYGRIGTIHKNDLNNLVVLCEACHLKQHHGKETIEDYVYTSEGVEIQLNSQPCSKSTEAFQMQHYLKYTQRGWMYRLQKNHKWKAIMSTTYPEIYLYFKNKSHILPESYEHFHEVMVEYQPEFLLI
uniref:DNA mismatch repair proteins mutS family domain-containing protein n=1 Tax=viral metagenome TaxID=1070528 RepID=A0A6C0CT66_9ZZZZ